MAFLVLLIQDPPHGINDEPAPEQAAGMTEVGRRFLLGYFMCVCVCVYLFIFGLVCGWMGVPFHSSNPPPTHQSNTTITQEEALAAARARGHWADYKTIFTNPYFMYGLAGVTANCFCL